MYGRQLGRGEQEFLAPGAAGVDVDGGKDTAAGEFPVQTQLHVARALQLFEEVAVGARAGVHEGRGEDGERAASLRLARGAEEPFGAEQRTGVDAAAQGTAAGGGGVVVGPAQPGQRVQQDDDVLTGLHQALGPLHDEVGEGDVLLGRPVEGGGVHLAAYRAAHLGDLLGALVQEEDHQPALGVVAGHGGGELLEQHRLAGLRRGHDQAALALADRCEQIGDASGQAGGGVLQADAAVRVERGEVAEVRPGAQLAGGASVDARDLGQGPLRAPDAFDQVALAQPMAADQGRCDLRIGG